MLRIITSILIALTVSISSVASDHLTVYGTVRDTSSKKKIANASIIIAGTDIGTVSNADGDFRLNIPDSIKSPALTVRHIGYKTLSSDVNTIKRVDGKVELWLTPASKILGEIVVNGRDPRSIVEDALSKIPSNYSSKANMFSAFYRETIQKGNRYIGVSEAMTDVYKTSYNKRINAGENVEVKKGRKIVSQKSSDTLSIKIVGGPLLPVVLDFVKNQDLLFSSEDLNLYNFELEAASSIDDRLQYVVRFSPRVKLDYALYKGLLYVDQETLTFTRAEFELDMSDKSKATSAILRKKPRGLKFKPQEMSFIVTYRQDGGYSYINYIQTKSRFKCDWKRRLFSSGYTTYAEMVMVNRDSDPKNKISGRDAFGRNDIFDDKVENYWDKDFWDGYNIIEPTMSLDKAVDKLRKQQHSRKAE